ncbi:MAG: inorganic phosphate transporter [Thermoanaerobaculales bacterium]|nr:inorganic phosphate transporter [Thermoanaerobaculales bacterium]
MGSKMIRFKTAAAVSAFFVVVGAVHGGSGAADTLGNLGAVNAIAGSFIVAFSAAFTVFWMTRIKLPVSTSQAIVGAIIGWNLFSGSPTDYDSLTKIVLTWVVCPMLSGVIAALLFAVFRFYLNRVKVHLLRVDMHTRLGLLLVGAFGSYSLGANNIANVMGVFVPAHPFGEISFFGLLTLSGTQVLFLLGGMAIAVGIFTYSHKVIDTVGTSVMRISPVVALVVVLAQSIVLFVFASEGLEGWLLSHGLPAVPLVPVSSSHAVVGAVIGIGLVKGGRGIRYGVLGEIGAGWVATPVVAGVITFVALFFLQNVFDQKVYEPRGLASEPVVEQLMSPRETTSEMSVLNGRVSDGGEDSRARASS